MADLPFVDEIAVHVAAPPEAVWAIAARRAHGLAAARHDAPRRLLGTQPPSGFAVTAEHAPREVRLAGRHRFARYELTFTVAPEGDGTRLAALTHAAFPGAKGRAYRALVIGSRAHVVVARLMLRAIAQRARC